MRSLILMFSFLVLFTITSCKKNRACECKNSNGTYSAGDIEGTKSQAKKSCEALSNADTECKLK